MPAMFSLALRRRPKSFREEFEGEAVEARAYMDDISLGFKGVKANTVRVIAFLRRQLDGIDIVVNHAKTVALQPKEHAPTTEVMSLLERVDIIVADEAGVTRSVGVPIGTEECVLERTMDVMKDGGADHLARCLANMPDKQAAAFIDIEPLGQKTSYLERALDTGLSLEACRRGDNGALWA